ncbi:MAG TPA: phytoene/squalene synthase family protein [Mycobacteriales bacterium]|nr:phytoene/squalene synthase family protein [Mycobacteriales bacterium]
MLATSYEACRRLHAQHGRSYYLATRLLPAATRPSVHALYGFARAADEVVDGASTLTPAQKAGELARLGAAVRDGDPAVPVAPAVHDTVVRHRIPLETVDAFLSSMLADLTVTRYATYDDLVAYAHGSASVVGVQLTHVFGTVVPVELASPYAVELGLAMQLTNVLRDVGEDLARGRVYLPLEDLDRFGVTVEQLHDGRVDERFRSLMRFEVARTRGLYATAVQGIRLLHPAARPTVEAATRLYAGILGAVERADYRVLDRRVCVSPVRRAALLVPPRR